MQTFLPLPDFSASAECLDRQRLGRQRVECLQILRASLGLTDGWRNHPATRMWRGYERALAKYGLACCAAWTARGYADTCADKLTDLTAGLPAFVVPPPWFGDPDFHSAHRAVLLAKAPDWYGRFGWQEEPATKDANGSYPYVWPV